MTLEDIKRLERIYRGIVAKILVAYDTGEKEYDAQKYRALCMARDTLSTTKTDILQANRHIGFVQALLWREGVCTMPQMRQYWIEQIEEYNPDENLQIELTQSLKDKMITKFMIEMCEEVEDWKDFEYADLYGSGAHYQLIYHHKDNEDLSASMEFEIMKDGTLKSHPLEVEED